MFGVTESQLENLCLDWFRTGGYIYAYGPDISHDSNTPERSDYQQVILMGRLISCLQKINPHIPLGPLEEAALTVTKPESLVLIHSHKPAATWCWKRNSTTGCWKPYSNTMPGHRDDHHFSFASPLLLQVI